MRGFRSRARGGIVAFLAIVVVAGIGAETASPITSPPTDTSPCAPAQTRSAFDSFVAFFNQGAFVKLDSLFAEKPAFQWYSSPHPGRRLGASAKRRDTLIAYFRRRHAKGEEFHRIAFHLSGNSRRWSNFWFEARRRAEGFNRGRWRAMSGKGAVICGQGSPQLIVLSLGGRPPRR